VGHEIKKTRPALIIQNDTLNQYRRTTMVAPITSTVRFPMSPAYVFLAEGGTAGLSVPSMALFDQIRVIDRLRLIRPLGKISEMTMAQADEAIKIALGLNQG
jgi:mRNA interferase MazF